MAVQDTLKWRVEIKEYQWSSIPEMRNISMLLQYNTVYIAEMILDINLN